MIALWAFNAIVFLCNWALVSSSILAAKDDGHLRIFKELPKFEYITKRHGIGDSKEESSTESKERRSTMSSSFIRFGRGQSELYDNSAALGSETEMTDDRHPRKSADIVIRFGRSKLKANNEFKRGDNYIRYGRNVQVVPADIDLTAVCQTIVVPNNVASYAEVHPDVARLLRLCNSLNKITGEINMNDFFASQAYQGRE